jgi:hypothetical protein
MVPFLAVPLAPSSGIGIVGGERPPERHAQSGREAGEHLAAGARRTYALNEVIEPIVRHAEPPHNVAEICQGLRCVATAT